MTGTAIHEFDAMVGTIAKLVKAAKVNQRRSRMKGCS